MRFEQTLHLSAPPETAWELLAHTDRLNREMGLPPIRFSFDPRAAGGTEVTATVQAAGLTLRYREHPFEWVRPHYYRVTRTFFGGPIREIRGRTELHAENSGTRVVVWAELDPANALGRVVCQAVGRKSIADFVSACRRFEEYLSARAATPYPRHSAHPPADRERLAQDLERLRRVGADSALAERLADYLAAAPPEDTTLIRPFALADAWGAERMALLETCLLAATREVKLLDARWRVLCPSCRGSMSPAPRLQDLTAQVHCTSCNIRFDSEFDRSVEVVFGVAPAVRPVHAATYCVGGPALTPHRAAQWILPPGSRREAALDLPPGDYALTSLQAANTPGIVVRAEGSPAVCVQVLSRGMGVPPMNVHGQDARATHDGERAQIVLEGEPEAVSPRAVWTLANDTDETVILRLETREWVQDAATAALVTTLQTFRDQFSSEVLSPGTELAVQQVCILFSDLKGSTAMYRTRGDAPSYSTVRDHFALMKRVITRHDGGIVKTIGDAVMAAFHDPADGLAAALAIQRENAADPNGLVVKLGLHWGPAIVVTANDVLDYFGQTVNLAARLQQESIGGDIVLASSLAEDPRAARLLAEAGVAPERFDARVRGLEERVEMLRLHLAPEDTEEPRK